MIVFHLTRNNISHLTVWFVCINSHSDPVCMARDEGAKEGKEASTSSWLDSQVLLSLFVTLPVFVCACICVILQLHFASTVSSMSFHPSCFFSLIKGFIYRHEEYCPENAYFLDHVRCSFLKSLRKNLPKSVLDKSWPIPLPLCIEVKTDVKQTCG